MQISRDFYDNDGHGVRWRYRYGVAPDGTPASRPPWMIDGECRRWEHAITQDEVQALVDAGRLGDCTRMWDGMRWVPKRWETKGFKCPACFGTVPQLSPEHEHAWCTCTGPMDSGRETAMVLMSGDDPRLFVPPAAELNANPSLCGLGGHDAINRWILIEARAKRLGVWGKCHRCKGKGELKLARKAKKRYENWEEREPPTGPGWQLWTTTNEGAPITPVFATAEDLADWCAEHETIWADRRLSRDQWLRMFLYEEDMEVVFVRRADVDTSHAPQL